MTETETERVWVSIPAYQKSAWSDHADDLGMSQSEFVKSMVQAGRRGFDPEELPSGDATPGVDALEDRVLDSLDEEFRSWDDLLGMLTDDLEVRLETTLGELRDEGRIRYSGRQGGYALTGSDAD